MDEKKSTLVENRVYERIEYDVEVTMESEDNFFTGFVKNISAGGLFIATHNLLDIGSKFKINLKIPEHGEKVNVDCEVRWIRPYNDRTPDIIPGMGVKFLNLDLIIKEKINQFITQKRDTIFYDDED